MGPDFSVLKRAGISQGEFGVMVGVSRVTVNNWVRDRCDPSSDHRFYVGRALKALARLIDLGRLPFGDDVSKRQRRAAVRSLTDLIRRGGADAH